MEKYTSLREKGSVFPSAPAAAAQVSIAPQKSQLGTQVLFLFFFSLMIIAGPGAQKNETKQKNFPLRLTRDKPGNKIKET